MIDCQNSRNIQVGVTVLGCIADNKIGMQHFRKLFSHIIYGNIKTRYNVFRKYANDVFGEYDFAAKKAYFIRLFIILMRLKAH